MSTIIWDGLEWKEVVKANPRVGGGGWMRRPALRNAIWRITNEVGTRAPWRLSDLRMFYDRACQVAQDGQVVDSGYFFEIASET